MSQRRSLGLFDITCLGLNCVIGSALFLTPGEIAAKLGSYAPLAFLVGALLCMSLALCFAEMASLFGNTGGAYLYARAAFGPPVGFLVGFVMWLSGVIGGATVAVGFSNMLEAAGLSPAWALYAISGIILTLALANFCGARTGAWSNNLLALLKLAPVLALALWALISHPWGKLLWPPASQAAPEYGKGFLLILYAFSGFEEIALPAGEVRRPNRDVPLAIVLVLLLSAGLYVIIQGLVGAEGLAGSEQPLQDAARSLPRLKDALVLAGIASLASINAAIAFTCPRSLWALAEGGWLPSGLAALHPRFGSPYRCVLISSGLTWSLAISGTFQHLIELSVLVSTLQYLATVLAVLQLRRQGSTPPLRPPLVVPLLALAVCLVLLFTSQWADFIGLAEALAVGGLVAWSTSRPGTARILLPVSTLVVCLVLLFTGQRADLIGLAAALAGGGLVAWITPLPPSDPRTAR